MGFAMQLAAQGLIDLRMAIRPRANHFTFHIKEMAHVMHGPKNLTCYQTYSGKKLHTINPLNHKVVAN